MVYRLPVQPAQPMGRIYLDFGESVVLEQAPDPEDTLALPKIAFEVAVQANKVTPITLPAVASMVLLGAAPRALTVEGNSDRNPGGGWLGPCAREFVCPAIFTRSVLAMCGTWQMRC